jgi:hypothetical protein
MTPAMRLEDTTETPGCICVHCGHEHSHTTGDGTPGPGDFTLCIRCGGLNVFDDHLRSRKATREEAREANEMDELQDLHAAIMRANAQAKLQH